MIDPAQVKIPTFKWRREVVSRFVLGTVQLGLPYGIANIIGKPAPDLAAKIVCTARQLGVNCFDTAQIYGNSESVLGRSLQHDKSKNIKLISKFAPGVLNANPPEIIQSIKKSCEHLHKTSLWAILLHRADELKFLYGNVSEALQKAKENALIKYLGVSVYTPDEAKLALEHPDIDVVQVPFNAWDTRMKMAGVFDLARSLEKICFIRSIYLQGLLSMIPDQIPERLPGAFQASKEWLKIATDLDISPAVLAFRYALTANFPLVIGVESTDQLMKNAQYFNEQPLGNDAIEIIEQRMKPLLNLHIINPAIWSNG